MKISVLPEGREFLFEGKIESAFNMLGRTLKRWFSSTMLVCALACFSYAGEPARPSAEAKCPVCGMFVAKYPDWVSQIHFRDGSVEFFDGAKDLFKYYFDSKKYRSARTQEDMVNIYVTEYYDLRHIDARKAFFVVGSDVFGPMGRELIPLAVQGDAEEFLRDHKGRKVLKFEDITVMVIQSLDQ